MPFPKEIRISVTPIFGGRVKQWPYNKMVECNELVLKSQLLNQLSCVSVTETGTLGRRVNYSGGPSAGFGMQTGSCRWSRGGSGTRRTGVEMGTNVGYLIKSHLREILTGPWDTPQLR